MIADGDPDEPTRTAYKALGYRLLATEGLSVQRLKPIPQLPHPVAIEPVCTPELAVRLGKVTRTWPIPSNLLGQDAPFRHYVQSMEAISLGACAVAATWCGDMYVNPSHRRCGIGQALQSTMLRNDRARGSK
jgi:GNAT superfamily N-acetyltransferase